MRKQCGFTLIELVATVGILSIAIAIATPNALTWMENAKTSRAIREVYSVIQDARMHSIKQNSNTRLEFNVGNDRFVSKKLDRATAQWDSQTHLLPAGLQLTAAFGAGSVLTYNSKGLPNLMGRVDITNQLGTVFRIVVNSTGSVRIERVSS